MDRRTRVALALLVAAALGGAARGLAVGVGAAREGDRWRRSLSGVDLVSDTEARLAPVRDLIPPDAVVGVTGDIDYRAPGDGGRFLVMRYALAPRRLRVGVADAPFVIALGEAAPVTTGYAPVLRLGPGLTVLRRSG